MPIKILIYLGLIVVTSIAGLIGIKKFNSHTHEKFSYMFFTRNNFIWVLVSWIILTISLNVNNQGGLNGVFNSTAITFLIISIISVLIHITYNTVKTDLLYGIATSIIMTILFVFLIPIVFAFLLFPTMIGGILAGATQYEKDEKKRLEQIHILNEQKRQQRMY